MEALLMERDLWHMIKEDQYEEKSEGKLKEDEVKEPTSIELKKWNIRDRRVRDLVWLCLADNILINVTSYKTAKDLWTKLENLYQSKLFVNKLFLWKRLYNLRMSKVRIGDDMILHMVGRGKVKLKMKDGTIKNLLDVMHIPGLTRNLLYVGTMMIELDVGLKEEEKVAQVRLENLESEVDEPDRMDDIVDSEIEFDDEAPLESVLKR
ncbi:uncharacterized protein LOC120296233 [Eucalyptus grandis]|uniref:uncharacterized protein LOC120296233 n=1 Tax=Eucalyptus grandis TaxID=71139 RepID=UPI00192EAF39|nr:uncharacterized protein LOC120296233 [Eucalyptus grandis]